MNEIPNTASTQPEVCAEETPTADEGNPSTACGGPPPLSGEAENPASEGANDTLEVKFNKQTYTLSREDATRYAQKGMKYDTVEPLLVTLREVAAREGKSLSALVEGLRGETSGSEEACRGEQCSPASMAEPPRSTDGRPYEADALAERLAEQYLELRREVPSVGGFDTLPPEALREAAESGISLLDAYLRHEHRERCRVAAEQAVQSAAAAASTGTQAAGAAEEMSPVVSAMMRGLWGR